MASKTNKDKRLEKTDNNILDLFKTLGFNFQIIKCGGNQYNFKLTDFGV